MLIAEIGRPAQMLSDEEKANFLYWVGEDLMINNAARHVGITTPRALRLMKQGEKDIEEGLDSSEFAHFYVDVRKKQAVKISEILNRIEKCPKNWQALCWKLEKCFREDFGQDAEMYKELLASYAKLFEDMKRLKDNPIDVEGVTINAQ